VLARNGFTEPPGFLQNPVAVVIHAHSALLRAGSGEDPLSFWLELPLTNLPLDVCLPSFIVMTARLNIVAEPTKSPRSRRHNSLIRVAFGSQIHFVRLFIREAHISVEKIQVVIPVYKCFTVKIFLGKCCSCGWKILWLL